MGFCKGQINLGGFPLLQRFSTYASLYQKLWKVLHLTISTSENLVLFIQWDFPEHFWGYVCIFQDSFTASAHPSSSKVLLNTISGWVVSPGLSLKYQGINKLWVLIGAWTLQMIPVYFRVERSYFSCGGWRSFCGGARLWNRWNWRVVLLWRGEGAF